MGEKQAASKKKLAFVAIIAQVPFDFP